MTPEPGQGGGESNFDDGGSSGGSSDTVTPEPGNSNDGSAFDGPPERSDRETFDESVDAPDPTDELTPDQREQFRQDVAEDSRYDSDEIVITDAERTKDGFELAFEPTTETRKEDARSAATEEFDERTLLTDISSDDIVFDGQEAELSAEAKARIAQNRAAVTSNDLDPDDVDVTFDSSGGIADVSLESEVSSRETSGTGTGSRSESDGVQDRTLEDVRESAADDLGVDPSAVELERVDGGFVARAEQEQQEDDFTFFDRGDDWPTNSGEASETGLDLLTGDGAELFETDVPTNRGEVSEAIISARQERLGINIDPIDPGRAADSAVDGVLNPDAEDGALAAAGLGVVTPEPTSTAAGALVLLGAAGAAIVSQGSELDVGQPDQEVSELEAGERRTTEVEVADPDVAEMEVGEPGTDVNEVSVPDSTAGDFETIETSATVAGGTQSGEVTDEDVPGGIGNPTDSPSVPDPLEEDTSNDRFGETEPEFPTGGGAVVDGTGRQTSGEDVTEPEVQAEYEFEDGAANQNASDDLMGIGGGLGGVGTVFGPRDRVEPVPEATGGPNAFVDVYTEPGVTTTGFPTTLAPSYATPNAQQYEYGEPNQFIEETTTPPGSRTRTPRWTPDIPMPAFDPDQNAVGGSGPSPVDIEIANPVATATDVLGLGTTADAMASPPESDVEAVWEEGVADSDSGWEGGADPFAEFDDGGDDPWDASNWEGSGDPFGGFQ